MEGGFRRNRQSGFSVLECGRLKVWAIGLPRNGILFVGVEPEVERCKASALKLRHLTACSVLEQEWFFVNYDTVSKERWEDGWWGIASVGFGF
jgi:hypothetical protein